MKKEITNGMKHDLQMVLCDHKICQERGDYGRCYLHNFVLCGKYPQRPPKSDPIWFSVDGEPDESITIPVRK